ncbi:MAG: hypothetical protein WBB39_01920 [Candidatus Saccharimonadales bacterium]
MTAGLPDTQLWPLRVRCCKCGEEKCPRRRGSRNKPVCKDCAGPVVMHVKLPKPAPRSSVLRIVDIHLGARTTNQAIETLHDYGITVIVTQKMHRLRIISSWDAHTRRLVLETLLNANSNALRPGGWSWLLREQVKSADGTITIREQLFQAPPATEQYFGQADPGLFYDTI